MVEQALEGLGKDPAFFARPASGKSFPLSTRIGAKVDAMQQLKASQPDIAQQPIVQVKQMQATASAIPPAE